MIKISLNNRNELGFPHSEHRDMSFRVHGSGSLSYLGMSQALRALSFFVFLGPEYLGIQALQLFPKLVVDTPYPVLESQAI